MSKIDITHTVALKNRPHPDSRLIRDLDTGEAIWVGAVEPVAPEPVEPEPLPEPEPVEPEPLPEPEHEKVTEALHRSHHKKLHHG